MEGTQVGRWLRDRRVFFLCVMSFVGGALSAVSINQVTAQQGLVTKSSFSLFPSSSENSTESFQVEVAESDVRGPFWEASSQESDWDRNFEVLNIDPEKSPVITDATPDRVLMDYQGRIHPDFAIPELIFNQTKFWFRIYTEFGSHKKVIHDSLHPHIIYDVVDVSDILAQPTRAAWLNTVKAQKVVSQRVADIRQKLRRMAKKKPEAMTQEELGWLAQFEEIRGNRSKIILTAAQNIRVQTGQKDFFEKGLSLSGRYLEGMEQIFRAQGLPVELTRLPFVESSFVIGATSKVGAAGIWQFMPGIGRRFMLVTDKIDERRNPWKATEAAAKLLKENHLILHKKWGLALTAYNHGPGGVRRAMQALGTKDIAKIVKSYRSRNFDFASANFYTCFLAALHAHAYRDILWPDHIYDPALSYDSLRLTQTFAPRQLMSLTGLPADQILLFNPELDRSFQKNFSIPKGYKIFLPMDVKLALQSSLGNVRASSNSLSSP